METLKINMTSAEKASRLELIIRFIWGTIVAIVLCILGIFVSLAVFVQWFHILLLGKRNTALVNFTNSYLKAYYGLSFYFNLSTDERPPLIPQF
ncbi:MAG: DUF4389 domain-containing protein [Candidatus Micrarchaeota archaeon]|nr:DUF4389 domain-containing protein [Candidatus Micrarchaeota archaeon]